MAGLFKDKPAGKEIFEEHCYVYVLCFDEAKGHMPLLIYPSEVYKDDKHFMRPIKYHPIWFLKVKDQDALDHVDVEYKGYTFLGKKFLTASTRKKKRAGLEEETPETIVIIVSLPNDLVIFGDELVRLMTQEINDNFKDKFSDLIEYFDAKDEIIKTPKVKAQIDAGIKIRADLRELIDKINTDFFDNAIKHSDRLSIKKQKALSFLALKGIKVSSINPIDGDSTFSDVGLFNASKSEKTEILAMNNPFKIVDINIIEDSNEIEIIVVNDTKEEKTNINVKINHVEDFFEKEIFSETVEEWYPEEEILFISPIIPHINEYIFIIIEVNNSKKLLTKKIDIKNLKKIKS